MAAKLKDIFPLRSIRRGQQYQGGPDSPDVTGLHGIHLECKRDEALNLTAAMQKLRLETSPTDVPLICHRKDRGEWLATFPLSCILQLAHAVAHNQHSWIKSCDK